MDVEDSEAVTTLCSSEDGENELEEETDISCPASSNVPPKSAEVFELQPTAPIDSGDKGTESSTSSTLAVQQQCEKRVSSLAQTWVEIFSRTGERRWSVAIASLIASIPSLLVGLTIAFPSNAVLDLAGEATELPQDYLLSTFSLSLFAALGPMGAILGGPIGGWVADHWGRKCSMMFCGVPYLIGYVVMSYTHYIPFAMIFKVFLLIGRFISGVGMGWASAVSPVYIAEISSFKLRGLFGTLVHLMLTSGVVLNYGVGAIDNFPYYYISLVAVGIVTLFEILMIWLPETPRWLLSRGYGKDAGKVLKWFRGPATDITNEMKEIKQQIISSKSSVKVVWKTLLKRNVLVHFVYILIAFSFVHLSGINVMEAFAGDLLTEAGVSRPRITSIYAIGLSNLVGILIAFLAIDLIGRKTLLVSSGLLMATGASMLGIHYFITRPSLCNHHHSENSTFSSADGTDSLVDVDSSSCNPQYGPLAIVSLVLYNFSFSIGWGPVPWLLLSELLPLSVRGVAAGFAMITNYVSGSITNGFYLKYESIVHPWFALWTFTLTNLVGALFVFVFIPETKGKSLEELERRFERKPRVRIETTSFTKSDGTPHNSKELEE